MAGRNSVVSGQIINLFNREVKKHLQKIQPSSFYFNGKELPKWSAHWHLCSFDEFLNGFEDDWDEFIGYKHIRLLQCRLDHSGKIESEEPLILKVCGLQVLQTMLAHTDEIHERIKQGVPSEYSAPDLFYNIAEGISKMISLSHQDGFAFWTNGCENDLKRLNSYISRFRNNSPDTEGIEPPHILERRSELTLRSRNQLTILRQTGQEGTLNKQLRSPYFPTS